MSLAALSDGLLACAATSHCPGLLAKFDGRELFPDRRVAQSKHSADRSIPPEPTEVFTQWNWAAFRETGFTSAEKALPLELEAIQATRAFLAERGITVAEVFLKDARHPSFHILPSTDTALGRLAAELVHDLPGIRLVYAPTTLMRGSAGFFSEVDSVMGISHAMLSSGIADETFHHEIIHAAHFLGRKQGILDPLNPMAKLLARDPGQSIGKFRDGYLRLQTLEEIEGSVESVAVEAMRLRPYLDRTLSSKEVDEVEKILDSLYFLSDIGQKVGSQSRGLVEQALSPAAWVTDSGWIAIPDQPTFWRRSIRIDSYTAEVANRWTVHPEGTEFSWRISTPAKSRGKPSIGSDELRTQLEKALLAANLVEGGFAKVRSPISWMIVRSVAAKTNLQAVVDAAQELDRLFNEWKRIHGRTAIPTLFDGR